MGVLVYQYTDTPIPTLKRLIVDQFTISPSSGVPIYKQLFSQIERMILNGYFSQGDSLPSVRQVAADLNVNPMTVSKAYGLLEERGYLTRLRGKGMMVAKREDDISEQKKLRVLNQMVENLMTDAQLMGVSQQQLMELFKNNMTTNKIQTTNKNHKE